MTRAEPIWALGAMSGTSLDGVDAAMILTDGAEVFEYGDRAYRAYSDTERDVLRAALGRWDGPEVDSAAEVVELAHAELLAKFKGAEVIGFHGQTTSHRPQAGATHQAGNGAVLAEALGMPVVWDFRSSDMNFGGQGAPLAPFYHFALAKMLGVTRPMAFLNIGGVANLTWVDPQKLTAEADGACLAFDTGPGNAKIDDLVQKRLGRRMDEGGRLAANGEIIEAVVEALMTGESYFHRMPPKSLDRDDFHHWRTAVDDLSDADAVATLTAATSRAIAGGLTHCFLPPTRMLVTGGGRKNPVMMDMIRACVDCAVDPVEEAGLDGDMLEAQAFAYLAVRVMRGLPTSAPGTTGVAAPVGGGQVSRPGNLPPYRRTDLPA